MMFAIKLTNVFQDAYDQQHPDGLLSERDVDGGEFSNPDNVKLFNTSADAEQAIDELRFIDAPDLTVVDVPD